MRRIHKDRVLTNAEKQARYRKKIKSGELKRVDIVVSPECDAILEQLSDKWKMNRKKVVTRLLYQAAKAESLHTPSKRLPSNQQTDLFDDDRLSKRHIEPVDKKLLKRLKNMTEGLTKGFKAAVLEVIQAECRRDKKGGYDLIDTETGKKWGVGITAPAAWRSAYNELLYYRNSR